MPFITIAVPDSISQLTHSPRAVHLIHAAHARIDAFALLDRPTIENFVRCDFNLFDQSLSWIIENHLLSGDRFCELGSGFGIATMLAALQGMESIGIELERSLVAESIALASEYEISVNFINDSFIPRDTDGLVDLGFDIRHIDTDEGDAYEKIGMEMCDFDLFFAFPWPGEHQFFESIFETWAADGAMLLTYRGRDGMHLLRKVEASPNKRIQVSTRS